MNLQVCALRVVAVLASSLFAGIVYANSVVVQVVDAFGQPVADAVVYAEPASGQALPKSIRTTEIEQKGRKFSPLVTVIQSGTEIAFPNRDTVRHHVYSFSAPKMFDIKLYSGVPSNPVLFDKQGTVVIGCNIHDQMVAYIHIVNTPYFAKTDNAGKARLDTMMPGQYQLKAWHFNLPSGAQIPEQLIGVAGSEIAASFKLNLKAGTVAN